MITSLKCIDGKRHKWKRNNYTGISICKKYNSTTEYCFCGLWKNPLRRVIINGDYNIKIPDGSIK